MTPPGFPGVNGLIPDMAKLGSPINGWPFCEPLPCVWVWILRRLPIILLICDPSAAICAARSDKLTVEVVLSALAKIAGTAARTMTTHNKLAIILFVIFF